MKQAGFFQILSDDTRLRALRMIAQHGELCVCELVHALEVSQPKISRHMATMRDAEIVQPRRHAQWVFYGISPALEIWQKQALSAAVDSMSDEPAAMNDSRRLTEMQARPERCDAA